jgi:hypothetical protein
MNAFDDAIVEVHLLEDDAVRPTLTQLMMMAEEVEGWSPADESFSEEAESDDEEALLPLAHGAGDSGIFLCLSIEQCCSTNLVMIFNHYVMTADQKNTSVPSCDLSTLNDQKQDLIT